MACNIRCIRCGKEYDIGTVRGCFNHSLYPIATDGTIIKSIEKWTSMPKSFSEFFIDGVFSVVCEKCRGDNYIQRL